MTAVKVIALLFLFGTSALAEDYVRLLNDEEVLLIELGQPAIKMKMEKGDCFPLLRVESQKLTDYVSDAILNEYAVLKVANTEFKVFIGTRDSYTKQLSDMHSIEKVSEQDLPVAIANYRDTVKLYREELIEARREEEAAAILGQLRDLQRQVDDLQR